MLTLILLGSTALVVAALFNVLWRERTSTHDARVALLCGSVLSLWAWGVTLAARRGAFEAQAAEGVPPLGINLVVVLSLLASSLAASTTLRGLLARQSSLIRLHLWRLVGAVFLWLMVRGQVPALWALPAGIGDILIGVTAPWIARGIDAPGGRRRGIVWNLLGLADLIVAVGLGMLTSPGATRVFDTQPTTELMTHFPMALVPTLLVPLAVTLHVVSLWQLLGGTWARPSASLDMRASNLVTSAE